MQTPPSVPLADCTGPAGLDSDVGKKSTIIEDVESSGSDIEKSALASQNLRDSVGTSSRAGLNDGEDSPRSELHALIKSSLTTALADKVQIKPSKRGHDLVATEPSLDDNGAADSAEPDSKFMKMMESNDKAEAARGLRGDSGSTPDGLREQVDHE